MKKIIIISILVILIIIIFGYIIKENIIKEGPKKIIELCPNLIINESISLLSPGVMPQYSSVGVSDEYISYKSGAMGGYGSTTFRFYLGSGLIEQSTSRSSELIIMEKGESQYENQFNTIIAILKNSLDEEHIKGTDQENRLNLIIECLENNY